MTPDHTAALSQLHVCLSNHVLITWSCDDVFHVQQLQLFVFMTHDQMFGHRKTNVSVVVNGLWRQPCWKSTKQEETEMCLCVTVSVSDEHVCCFAGETEANWSFRHFLVHWNVLLKSLKPEIAICTSVVFKRSCLRVDHAPSSPSSDRLLGLLVRDDLSPSGESERQRETEREKKKEEKDSGRVGAAELGSKWSERGKHV